MKRIQPLLGLMLTALLPLGALAETKDGVEMVGKGEIRWNERVIRASGSGAPNADAPNVAVARITAERTAEMDARRNILEVLKGVQIDSSTTVGGKMSSSDVIQGKVSGIVRGARVVDKKYFSDGGVEVTLEMPIDASVLESVLPLDAAGDRVAEGKKDGTAYTGLVVDARGTAFDPALSPVIADENGTVIYDLGSVEESAAASKGLADYVTSDEELATNKRKGDSPLTVMAAGAEEGKITLGAADAQKIADSNQTYLKKANVVILVD